MGAVRAIRERRRDAIAAAVEVDDQRIVVPALAHLEKSIDTVGIDRYRGGAGGERQVAHRAIDTRAQLGKVFGRRGNRIGRHLLLERNEFCARHGL